MYVVVGVGIGNKILQVCLDSGQNRLSKKISYVYLGGQVEQFLRQEFQGPSLNISIQTYIRRYFNTVSEGTSNNLLKNKR